MHRLGQRDQASGLKRLGIWNVVFLIAGTVVELGALGFLAFLWGGSHLREASDGSLASSFWRTVVLGGWTIRAVTLTSVIIRQVMAFQAVLCVGILASILFEDSQFRLANAAYLSTLRAVNGGPLGATFSMPSSLLRSLPGVILLVLTLATIVGQFSSTLLVSDIPTLSLLGDCANISALMVSVAPWLGFRNGWKSALTTYPSYGEEILDASMSNGMDIVDSGNTRRILLPFQSAGRQSLRRYSGMALAVDTRVVCVRPYIEDPVITFYANDAANVITMLSGNVTWHAMKQSDQDFLDAVFPAKSIRINCTIPIFDYALQSSPENFSPYTWTTFCDEFSANYEPASVS